MPKNTQEKEILTVSELNRITRGLVESQFNQVWVEGEISNFVQPRSGHWYFTLKDDDAQVRCAMFVNRNRMLRFKPSDGMQVILRGKASLYEGRGEFQLIADNLIDAGEGRLQRRFEELKRKLSAEGLFDDAHKSPLPAFPQHIGIITSATGAALQDILTVLQRRFPALQITLIATAVQGEEAPAQLIQAIQHANDYERTIAPLDALIVGRGGGSIEDLWAFNDEGVARAIFASDIPIVSAVGHEIDFTIADFVADMRAPTPSAAAELLSIDQYEFIRILRGYEARLVESARRTLSSRMETLAGISKRIRHPQQKLQDQMQRLDELDGRFKVAMRNHLTLCAAKLAGTEAKVQQLQPSMRIQQLQRTNVELKRRMHHAMTRRLEQQQSNLAHQAKALDTLSPLATIGRGFAVVKDKNDTLVTSIQQTAVGDVISTQVSDGVIASRIESITDSSV